jgi:hypothetical protein
VPEALVVVPPPPPAPTDEVRGALREGRAKLKENNGAAALVFFKARKTFTICLIQRTFAHSCIHSRNIHARR